MAAFTPASEYAEFRQDDTVLPQTTGNDMAAYNPVDTASTACQATPAITDTCLDFSSYTHDDLLASASMRTPSPFSFLQSLDDSDYMFFGDLSTPLSPMLPSSTTMALGGTPSCAAPTPLAVEEPLTETANCNVVAHKNAPNSTFHLVSTPVPSPLNGLVLGTATISLASFPSRMRLTERDFEALLLFHQQVGFSIGSKSPVWSTHAILIKLSVHHAPILHLLLAASFGELDWRITAESGNNSITGSATSAPAILPAPHSTKGGALTPGQLARRHYNAGQAALKELTVAPRGTAEAGLYHVVVVACFWLEYLIHRRNTLQHGRWGSNNEFSKAMGDYMRKYQLRRGLMSTEALPLTSMPTKCPPSPPKRVPVQEDEDSNGDEDDETDEPEFIEDEAKANTQISSDQALAKPTAAPTNTNMAKAIKDLTPADRPLPPVKYRSFLSRLLSWLYWSDCVACFFGKGGALSVQFRMPPRSQVGFYETARTTLLDFWDDYTPEEIADDNQNWPALQLINETWVAVHRLNLAYEAEEMQDNATAQGHNKQGGGRRSFSSGSTSSETVAQIARDARALRSRYTTVFRLCAFAATSGGHRSRLLAMADWAVCHYLALELHLLRAGAMREDLYGEEGPAKELALLGIAAPDDGLNSSSNMNSSYDYNYNYGNYQQQQQQPSFNSSYQNYSPLGAPASHRQAIAAQIVHLAERAIRTVGPVELDRFQWPLFWAGVETDNRVYRYFVLSNLINADFRVALQTVVREQSAMSMSGAGGGEGGNGGNGSEIRYYATTGGTGVSMRRLRTICRAAGMAA